MKINSLDKEDLTILVVDGELDASSSILLDESIESVVAQGKKKILIDGQSLNYISSAGLGVFMSHVQEFEEKGIQMILFGLNEKVLRVFQILGLDQLLSITASEDEAIQLLNASL
ncbi:STAS domain-containing protein [Cytophagaceae bacterium DM2B3-1]|uniref:Anti-sigma factor antagonist n=1 Tax=Xanthocytophaga flava TaxID=3048013 RepID=A0ABT7CD96_9BACT|nr:STAS domain-containing protein [Xanthocytophaga flavus]MDJ1471664.1 STAS domain-containing protein [Xanthocytophaga flavus]MDJ1491689.1 STAS domain-containing protein [Xanthocytophaga flavus]